MDFCHLIVTCLFSKLRLPFDNQKVKENYAIFSKKCAGLHGSVKRLSWDQFENLGESFLFCREYG